MQNAECRMQRADGNTDGMGQLEVWWLSGGYGVAINTIIDSQFLAWYGAMMIFYVIFMVDGTKKLVY